MPIAVASAGYTPATGLRLARHALDAVAPLVPAWRELAARPLEDNAFFQPGFALAAAEHVAEAPVTIATVTGEGGRLLAVAPVTETKLGRVAPAARLWSHRFGPLGVPLVEPERAAPALTALMNGLAPLGSGMSLVLPDLPADGPVAGHLTTLAENEGRPFAWIGVAPRAVIGRGDGDPLEALPRRRRKEYQRQLRRLGDRGEVGFTTAAAPDEVRAHLAEFLELEAEGWKGRRGTALMSATATAQFARKAIFERASAGAVRIDSLALDGKPVAMVISFVDGATMFTWKIAYREDFASHSPGAQLMLALPGRAFADDRIDLIDSCAEADHPMIDGLWAGRRQIGTLLIGPRGGGPMFQIGEASARAEYEARQAAKRFRRSFLGER